MTTLNKSNEPLKQASCVPCEGKAEPLQGEALQAYSRQLPVGWRVIEEKRLQRTFRFPDFLQALDFVNTLGAIAEHQGHHPDIALSYGRVTIDLWTHKINGLHANDFIMAAKIDSVMT